MHMAPQTKRWTRAELAQLPDDNNKYEVVRGELFVTPAPRLRHQQLIVVLARLLAAYVARHGLGDIHQARSVMIFDGSEVEPDLMVRPLVRPPLPEWEDAPIPVLVVEVLSDTTQRRDHVAKRALYLAAGVAEYWIVDGDTRSITVVRRDRPDELVLGRLVWHPTGATALLEIDAAEMFLEALG